MDSWKPKNNVFNENGDKNNFVLPRHYVKIIENLFRRTAAIHEAVQSISYVYQIDNQVTKLFNFRFTRLFPSVLPRGPLPKLQLHIVKPLKSQS